MLRAVILKPLINEKSMVLTKDHLYTFVVDKRADKRLIGRIVAEMFNVEVLSVKTINILGKRKLQFDGRKRRISNKTFQERGLKKAIVQVKKGQKITVFESVPEEQAEVKTAETETVREKKSFLKGTKVKIESSGKDQESSKKEKEESKK